MDYWPVVTSGFIQGLGMALVFVPLLRWISFAAVPLLLLLQKPTGKVEVVHSE